MEYWIQVGRMFHTPILPKNLLFGSFTKGKITTGTIFKHFLHTVYKVSDNNVKHFGTLSVHSI